MIIDISKHNGVIDFKKVKEAGVTAVVIKATEGTTYVDPMLRANALGAKAAGLKIGYYHFATFNSLDVCTDAMQECSFFLHTISSLPAADFILALDAEKEPMTGYTPVHMALYIHTFMGYLFEDLVGSGIHQDAEVVLYSYAPFLDRWLPKNHALHHYLLWHAGYTSGPKPRLPKGWAEQFLWQYTDKGSVPGIVGNVDLNK